MPTEEKYELEKPVWTAADFEVMGWHDATIWSMAVVGEKFELLFDIDYILRWVHPVPPEQYFSFWVSPATLVFEGVQNIKIDIEIDAIQHMEIADIHRVDHIIKPSKDLNIWKWTIELQQGSIEFYASGYTQYFRRHPSLGRGQVLDLDERGGISFDRNYIS